MSSAGRGLDGPLPTSVVAELGGRAPALVTAVVSATSLNSFLTEPYLTLTINDRDDIIAFVALAVTGLIAAAFGRRRARTVEAARRSREDVDALAIAASILALEISRRRAGR
jgi:two-component system, OmpR family, sensor histidine kinase KdpD